LIAWWTQLSKDEHGSSSDNRIAGQFRTIVCPPTKPVTVLAPSRFGETIIAQLRAAQNNFRALEHQSELVAQAAEMMIAALQAGNKVMFCGNGGSAADSQHLAAELMGRYMRDRRPLPALSLTVDTSALTAIGNDYGYDEVFARQLRGIGAKGDVLVGISTSGNSANVVKAVAAGREMGIRTIALTGQSGGKLADSTDLCIAVPALKTNEIQEMHIAIGHMVCGLVEDAVC
jgi:D-sedoheptulose 7-phosphate isomerase